MSSSANLVYPTSVLCFYISAPLHILVKSFIIFASNNSCKHLSHNASLPHLVHVYLCVCLSLSYDAFYSSRCNNYTITYRKGASNGKAGALSRNLAFLPSPLPSLPIFSPTGQVPLLHTPHLRGAPVMLLLDDPLLPKIAAAQAADRTISATMATLQRGPSMESNPALRGGRPSGRSQDQFHLRAGIFYHHDRILIPPCATPLILKIL